MKDRIRYNHFYNEEGFYEGDDLSELKISRNVLYKGDHLNPYKIAYALFHIPMWEKDLVIHPECEEIEDYAFEDTDPYRIRIPGSVKRIGKGAFSHNRPNLKKIIIDEGTEYIDEEAFCNCYYVARIELPSTIKELGKDCFSNIEWLLRIVYNGTKKQWNQIKKDNFVTGGYRFKVICKDGEIIYNRTERYCRYDHSDDKVTLEFVKDSILEILNTEQADNIERAKSYYRGLNAYLTNVEKLDEKEISKFYKGLARLFVHTHKGVLKEIHQTYLEITGLNDKEMSYKRFSSLMTSKTYIGLKKYTLDLVTTSLPRYRRFYVVMIGVILINGNHELTKKDRQLIDVIIGPVAN